MNRLLSTAYDREAELVQTGSSYLKAYRRSPHIVFILFSAQLMCNFRPGSAFSDHQKKKDLPYVGLSRLPYNGSEGFRTVTSPSRTGPNPFPAMTSSTHVSLNKQRQCVPAVCISKAFTDPRLDRVRMKRGWLTPR